MPRVGQNPTKWVQNDRQPKLITVTTVVHIPMLDDYWAESLDVLKLSLNSLLENTRPSFDLMVFDNNSCSEVQDYLTALQHKGAIQYLILSEYNMRKLGALNFLLAAAPGDLVSFADSDVYFMPGWLEATLRVMEVFPEAGQVTALPTVDKTQDHCERTYDAVAANSSVVVEAAPNLVSDRYTEAHRISIGKTKEQYHASIGERNDTRISRHGVSAYVSAQDFQFTTKREVIDKVLPLRVDNSEDFYDPIYSPVFEARVDSLGYWRLSTTEYLVHHIGNRMPSTQQGIAWIFDENQSVTLNHQSRESLNRLTYLNNRLVHNRYVRRFLKWVNATTYSLLYEK